MDNEQPRQELVKCVVVGDTAVGKTRLICARACNKKMCLSQLLSTHVPTVWAIDQYRMCKDVLQRSWEVVDGVNVSLRLWDTFGDHDKDRRFAYGRSDVVLLCFSLANPVSLRNCKTKWFPEIRQFCPNTPILLVGCKNDLRFMYRDETYLSYFRDKSQFIRRVQKCDLIMPEEARAVAREFGAQYYETSVLTYFGVNEVFENAIRAALISRRNHRFWMTNLRKIQKPHLQSPYCPPKPRSSPVQIPVSNYDENMLWLYQQKSHTDLIFIAESSALRAHKFILAAASPIFYSLFKHRDKFTSNSELEKSTSESCLLLASNSEHIDQWNECKEYSLQVMKRKPNNYSDVFKERSFSGNYPFFESQQSNTVKLYNFRNEFTHPIFLTETKECDELRRNCPRTIITLSKLITAASMAQCLQFLYTATLDPNFTEFQELREAAQLLEFRDLLRYINNVQGKKEFLNIELRRRYQMKFRKRLMKICLEEKFFPDILFQFDDGVFPAHRALLSARCDVMRAMFSGNFIEKDSEIVLFPGVCLNTFYQLLVFLYTDDINSVSSAQCVDLIELANRLCLPRLINLIEKAVVDELNRFTVAEGSDLIQMCLMLLETCKLHNANQLAEWCMIYLCVNYNELCKMSSKLVKGLQQEHQLYLTEHRWPPVWYLKDLDYYVKHAHEKQKEDKALFKRSSNSRCPCFGRDTNIKTNNQQTNEASISVTWKIR